MSRHNFIISILQKPKRLFKISKNDIKKNKFNWQSADVSNGCFRFGNVVYF